MNFIAAEEISENCTDSNLKIDFDNQECVLSNPYQEEVSNLDSSDVYDSNDLLRVCPLM